MEEEEYSKESEQAAVKTADKGREGKIEEVSELEKECTGIITLPREDQATTQDGLLHKISRGRRQNHKHLQSTLKGLTESLL